ncbi:hypothetical protein SUGI_0262280 [Cryptomeria japonica]|nr:hypothetical protein SUGI_0262280 [Cryptomeria japonica]
MLSKSSIIPAVICSGKDTIREDSGLASAYKTSVSTIAYLKVVLPLFLWMTRIKHSMLFNFSVSPLTHHQEIGFY